MWGKSHITSQVVGSHLRFQRLVLPANWACKTLEPEVLRIAQGTTLAREVREARGALTKVSGSTAGPNVIPNNSWTRGAEGGPRLGETLIVCKR